MSTIKGYVYILTNPSFRDDWVKIWKSSRPVDVRSKELDNTSIPLPFHIFATVQSKDYEKIEKKIHKIFEKLAWNRIRKGREFFNITPWEALDYIKDLSEFDEGAIILWPDYYNWTRDWVDISQSEHTIKPKPHSKKEKNVLSKETWNGKPILWRAWTWEVNEKQTSNMVFHHKRKEMDGQLICKDWIYILKTWSFVNPDITSNVDAIKKMRELSKKYIIKNRTTEDLPFYSASGASQYICWTASNWWDDRIDENENWLSKYRIN